VNGADSTGTSGGLYVYDKYGNRDAFEDPVDFWCGVNGVNDQPLIGCVNHAETLHLTDPQVGFDSFLGRWIVTEMAVDKTSKIGNIYVAASTSVDATKGWEFWSEPVCTTDSSKPLSDQPLLGWSTSLVAVDVTCYDSSDLFGADNLVLIPNLTITTPAASLPSPISAPCSEMAPARLEVDGFSSSLYLLASIVPTTQNLANCAPSSSNTEPYVVEYTATTGGVFGSGGCAAGTSGCSPVSISPESGSAGTYGIHSLAQQEIASTDLTVCAKTAQACEIDLGDARITSAQIKVSNVSGTISPILTTSFTTGILASGSGIPMSQNLWFIQSLGTGTGPGDWLDIFKFAGGDQWMAYPTIALDDDQEFYLGITNFQTSIFPQTIWQSYAGLLSPTFLGQNVLESSASTYIGQAGTSLPDAAGPQRWGDYNSMSYDPSTANAPGGEGPFWQVEEISKGGADESTTWIELADPTPLPYFVGFTQHESECSGGVGSTCKVNLSPPTGVQPGDLLLVSFVIGESASHPVQLPDSSWTLLPALNLSGSPQGISASCCGGQSTSWLAAHIYSSSDTLPYEFKHYINTAGAEFEGFMVDYRSASTNLSSLGSGSYGFAESGKNSSISSIPLALPGESKIAALALGIGDGCDDKNSSETVVYSQPTGAPALAREAEDFWLEADVGAPNAVLKQEFGAYTFSASPGGCFTSVGPWFLWEVDIPGSGGL
jgi:hypothetical protein